MTHDLPIGKLQIYLFFFHYNVPCSAHLMTQMRRALHKFAAALQGALSRTACALLYTVKPETNLLIQICTKGLCQEPWQFNVGQLGQAELGLA